MCMFVCLFFSLCISLEEKKNSEFALNKAKEFGDQGVRHEWKAYEKIKRQW